MIKYVCVWINIDIMYFIFLCLRLKKNIFFVLEEYLILIIIDLFEEEKE